MPLPLDDVGQFCLKIYDTLPIFSTGIVCFATTMHTFLTAPQLKIPSKGVQTDFLAARIQMAVDAHGGSFEKLSGFFFDFWLMNTLTKMN